MRLIEILGNIILEYETVRFWDKHDQMLSEESKIFTELANPDNAYPYEEVSEYVWEFKDKYGNTLGIIFKPEFKTLDSYYKVRDLSGKDVLMFDYEVNKERIDPKSYKLGTDEHRSDTICKIIVDEVVPRYLLKNKAGTIRLHTLNQYSQDIFWKCAEVCKKKYPQLDIKNLGKDTYIINR